MRPIRALSFGAAVLLLLVCATPNARAANIFWTNASGGNFSQASNWNPPQVPGSSDSAIINLPGTYTVTVDASATVKGLYLGAASGTQKLLINGNTLEIVSHSLVDKNGYVQISSGILKVDFALTSRGTIEFSGGSITSGGTLFNYGSMLINNSTSKILDTVTLSNYGTLTWSDSGATFDIRGVGGTIYNLGMFDITGDSTIQSSDGVGTITNLGLMKKSAGTGETLFRDIGFAIEQSSIEGTLEVDAGTLTFDTTSKFLPYTVNNGNLTHGKYLVKSVLKIRDIDIQNLVTASITLDGIGASIQKQSGTSAPLDGLSTIDSNSKLTLVNGASLSTTGGLTSYGTVLLDNSTLQTGNIFDSESTTTLLNNAILMSPMGITVFGGTLSGQGTLDGPVTNSALISPGLPPATFGQITMTSTFDNSGGTVALKVGGTAGGQYDSIANSMTNSIDGALFVTCIIGYKPAINDTITVISGTQTTGTFSSVAFSGAAGISATPSSNSTAADLTLTFNMGILKTWTGTGGNNRWGNPNNWTPSGIPTSTDNVQIPPGPATLPVLDDDFFCRDLLIDNAAGARLDLNQFNLTVNGNLQTSGAIVATNGGVLKLAGTGTSFESIGTNGSLANTNITGHSFATHGSLTVINGALNLTTAGILEINGGHVTVNGDYAHVGGIGLLKMLYPSDQLTINGNASFDGQDESGYLVAGLLEIQGTLTTGTNPQSFVASAPHVTRFTGAASVANPTGNQSFGNLEVGTALTSANLQFAADAQIAGDVTISKGGVTSAAGITVSLLGNLFDPPGGNWRPESTTLRSSSPHLPPMLQTHLHFFPANPTRTVTLPAGFTLTGSSDLDIDDGTLEIGDKLVVVGNDVQTTHSGGFFGTLQMTSQFGELSALHDAVFGGDTESELLLAGRLRVKHDLHALPDEVSKFSASLVHVVTFDGTGAQTVTFDNAADLFQNVEVNNAAANVSFAQDTLATGTFTLLNGTVTIPDSTTLTALGGYFQNAGSTILAGVSSSLAAPSPAAAVVKGGTFSGIGFVVGDLQNSGIVAPGLAGSGNEGKLEIDGAYTQHPGGALAIRVNSTSVFDQLLISSGNLAGALNLTADGYSGALNDSFPIVSTMSTYTGVFAPVNGMNISSTLAFTTQYNAANVQLVVLQRPQITNATLTAAGTVGQPFNYAITATGSPTISLSAAPLPAGLSLNGATISGTPTMAAAGTTQVTLTASSSAGTDVKTLAITIVPFESGPPVITSVSSTPNPQRTGSGATFTALASQPDNLPLTYTWDFQDGSAPVVGNPVTHIFTIENTFAVTVTVSDSVSSVQGTVSQQVFAPSSSGTGVGNITQNDPPAVDPFNGITLSVSSSEGGVLTFAIDINSLLRDEFTVGTDFQSISGRSDSTPGLTVVHKFTDPGVYVATSSATDATTRVLRGKARKTVPISGAETGATPKFTTKPRNTTVNVNAIKGAFIFGRSDTTGASTLDLPELRAAKTKPDIVTLTGSIELPEGLDLSQSQSFSFGIGNIIDQVTVDAKGKAKLPSSLGRVKALTIRYPRLSKGTKLTSAGQSAKFTISISQTGLSAAGFDSEGITGTLKSGETAKSVLKRTIQIAMAFAGSVWQVQAPVQFKLSTDASSGSISGRSGF